MVLTRKCCDGEMYNMQTSIWEIKWKSGKVAAGVMENIGQS